MVDELGDGLDHSKGLDVAWGFDLDVFLQEHAHQASVASEAGDGARGRRGHLLGPRMDGRKRPGRSVSLPHRQGKGGPVGEGSTRAQQLGTAPRNSVGPDPGSKPALGRVDLLSTGYG